MVFQVEMFLPGSWINSVGCDPGQNLPLMLVLSRQYLPSWKSASRARGCVRPGRTGSVKLFGKQGLRVAGSELR